jgi:NADH dehydrogenase (ubiquinone) 1 alpha subcomplex subunit 2
MKRNNPNIPILIREAAGTQPKVFARYGRYPRASEAPPTHLENRSNTDIWYTERGVEKSQILEGLSDKEIEDTVTSLVKTAQ